MKTGQVIWLLVILTLSWIEISAAINATYNSSIYSGVNLNTLAPYGEMIKNNVWFITIIACIFAGLTFFIGPGIFRDKIWFLRSKRGLIDGENIIGMK